MGDDLRKAEVRAKMENMAGMFDDDTLVVTECVISLHDTYQNLHETLNNWLADSKLSAAKFDLLKLLKYGVPDHQLPMAEIGARMCVTGANVTGLVDGLERQGLVARANLPGDRRVVLAQLTSEGEQLMEEIVPLFHKHLRVLWSQLSEAEILQLTQLLTKLDRSIDAASAQG